MVDGTATVPLALLDVLHPLAVQPLGLDTVGAVGLPPIFVPLEFIYAVAVAVLLV